MRIAEGCALRTSGWQIVFAKDYALRTSQG